MTSPRKPNTVPGKVVTYRWNYYCVSGDTTEETSESGEVCLRIVGDIKTTMKKMWCTNCGTIIERGHRSWVNRNGTHRLCLTCTDECTDEGRTS